MPRAGADFLHSALHGGSVHLVVIMAVEEALVLHRGDGGADVRVPMREGVLLSRG